MRRLFKLLRQIFFPDITYHSVVVVIDGKPYRVADNYAYQLICTKCSGWQLWWIWNSEEKLIGGEYDSKSFSILVGEKVMCRT